MCMCEQNTDTLENNPVANIIIQPLQWLIFIELA